MGPGASRSRVDSRSAATELSGACGPAVLHPAEASRPDAAQRLGIVARGSGHRLSRQWRDARRKPDRSAPHLRHRPADRGFASHHHAYRREQRRRSRGGRPPYALPSLPFAITAERRQAIGRFSTGRSTLRCSPRAASTRSRSGGTCCSTTMPRPVSSESANATSSRTAAWPSPSPCGAASPRGRLPARPLPRRCGPARFDAREVERQRASRLAPAPRGCGRTPFRSCSDARRQLLKPRNPRCGLASGRLCR